MKTTLVTLALATLAPLLFAQDFSSDDLTRSCSEGNLQRVETIVRSGVNVSARDKKGWFPLSIAAAHGQVEVMKYLLKKGADVNERTSKKNTPLIFAASRGHLPAVKLLLQENADARLANLDKETAASSAKAAGYPEVAQAIEAFLKR